MNVRSCMRACVSTFVRAYMCVITHQRGFDLPSMNLSRPNIGVMPVPAAMKYIVFTGFNCKRNNKDWTNATE